MNSLDIFEALCGALAIYIGAGYWLAGRIPIQNEGETEPIAEITGWEVKAVSCLFICFGLYLIALATGFLDFLRSLNWNSYLKLCGYRN